MRRRLDLAGAWWRTRRSCSWTSPTTGLDPRSRTDMWAVIARLVAGRTSLLLTTQCLEEADRLCDEIVVIDHGLVIAQGPADQLKDQVGGERLQVTAGLRRPTLDDVFLSLTGRAAEDDPDEQAAAAGRK